MRNRIRIVLGVVVVLAVMVSAIGTLPVLAKENVIKVRIAHLFPEAHILGRKMAWVAQELEKRSNGRFKCEVFAGGSAGGEKENLEDLLLGNIELMCGAGSYFYKYVPECNVVELPGYGWASQREARDVVRGYWDNFVAVAEKKGFYPVGLDIKEFWGVLVKKPVTSLSELKGLKFRSVNADYWIAVTKLYGAVPVPLPAGDAYLAFKTGVAEGVVQALSSAWVYGWGEVLKCYLDTRLALSLSFLLTSKAWFKQLPPDLRNVLLEVGRDSEEFNLKEVERELERAPEEARKLGIVIPDISSAELAELYKKAVAFREEYMRGLGPQVYRFYQDWMNYVEQKKGKLLR